MGRVFATRILACFTFLCTLSNNSGAQKAYKKTICIDSLIGAINHFDIIIEEGSNPFLSYPIVQTLSKPRNTKSLFCTVESDSLHSTLMLRLDSKGGYLMIKNFFLCTLDTFQIKVFSVFKNNIPDSIVREVCWFMKYPNAQGKDRIVELNRNTQVIKREISLFKRKLPHSLNLIINGASVSIPVKYKDVGKPLIIFHGHEKMAEKDYLSLLESGNPYKYFAEGKFERRYIMHAEIDLKL
jgi:hypothetical protein